jgi:hypothetical protein
VLIFFGIVTSPTPICEFGESCEESCEAIVPRLGDGLTRFAWEGLTIYGSGFLLVAGDCGRSHHGVCTVLWLMMVCIVVEARALLSAKNHRFVEGEDVPLFANKVDPFHNPRYTGARSGSNCSIAAV